MLAMDLALVPMQTTGVGKSADVFAAGLFAGVGSGVFIHVFAISCQHAYLTGANKSHYETHLHSHFRAKNGGLEP